MQMIRKMNLCIVLLIVMCQPTLAAESKSKSTKIELPTRGICAHRGASDTHPENTLAAFREAARLGAHQIEFDVQLTKDGHLVIMHDATVNRTTDGKGRVADLTLAEIKKLDAGKKKHVRFSGCRVPTLAEALAVMPQNVWLNLHLKGGKELGRETAREVVRQNRTHQAFLACGAAGAEGAREICPDIKICNMERQYNNPSGYVNDTIKRKSQFIQLVKKVVTPDEMKRLHQAGIKINLFEGPTIKSLKKVLDAGVDFPLVNDVETKLKEAEQYGIKPLKPVY